MNRQQLHIYHTNDLHSHLEHWPRIRSFLQAQKAKHHEDEDECFLFDIGDHVDRWHPLTDASRGKRNIDLLNEVGYTAVTIGNNEGITLSHEELDTLYNKRNFDVIVANFYENEKRPSWVTPYQIYDLKNGVRVAVLGLTAYFVHFYELLGWKLTEPLVELQKQLKEIREKADIVILLSHLGIHDDEAIAERHPEIDVIIGAHTHHVFHEGKNINGVLLGAAGKYGMYVGHITLFIDPETKKVIYKQGMAYDSQELPSTEDEQSDIDGWYDEGKRALDVPVATVSEQYRSREVLARLLCDTLQSWCNVDSAFVNEGMILHDLKSEQVSEFELLTTCPHPINPCVVDLSGAEYQEVIRQALDPKWSDMLIKGLGFRGTLMGKMIFTGVEWEANEVGHHHFKINGQPLKSQERYKVAIPDMFTFGYLFPEIRRAEHKSFFFPEFMRDLLRLKLQSLEQK